MCGIIGMLGKITKMDEKLFKSLLTMDIVRGKDSTGVFSVGQEIMWFKDTTTPPEFYEAKGYDQVFLNAIGGTGIIGHNRAATLGVVNKDNAHPFYHDGIIGVHNGTLNEFLPVDKDFGTDSEGIFYDLSKRTAKEVVEDLDGAFALVWYSDNEQTWYVCRNDERPLHYFMGKDAGSDQMIISSEEGILYAALSRAGYPSVTPDLIQEFKKGVLYSIKAEQDKLTTIKIVEEEVTLKDPWAAYRSRYANYNSYNNYGADTWLQEARQNLFAVMGVRPSWFPAVVETVEGSSKWNRTVKGSLTINDIECKFVLYTDTPPQVGDAINVRAAYLNDYSHGNRTATAPEDMTVNCDDWSMIGASQMDDDIPFSCNCINCDSEITDRDAVKELGVGGVSEYVCNNCYDSDVVVQQYVQYYGVH